MKPLGLPVQVRKSAAAEREITLTPHGQELHNTLNHSNNYILVSSIHVLQGTDPGGHNVRIFIDPVAFFGLSRSFRDK